MSTVGAGLFVRAFHKVMGEGRVVRSSVLALMYVSDWVDWVAHHMCCGINGWMDAAESKSRQPTDQPTALVPPPPLLTTTTPHHTTTYARNRRVWRTWSLAAGADVTWGALDSVAKALQITPVELEGGTLEAPEGERCVLLYLCVCVCVCVLSFVCARLSVSLLSGQWSLPVCMCVAGAGRQTPTLTGIQLTSTD
jgi:hypothetical protein